LPGADRPQTPTRMLSTPAPQYAATTEGISSFQTWAAGEVPDTNGASGLKEYVQITNAGFEIFDKTTMKRIYGPAESITIFKKDGTPCAVIPNGVVTSTGSDPIVLFDQLAQRWLISFMATPKGTAGPFYECVAVSAGASPLGRWYRYSYLMGQHVLGDYPKFGVWPDGYYMTTNDFDVTGNDQNLEGAAGSEQFNGVRVTVLDRHAMLAGEPADAITFTGIGNPDFVFGALPSSIVGTALPPSGAPNHVVAYVGDSLKIFDVYTDWAHPDSSYIAAPVAMAAPVDASIQCGTNGNVSLACIDQPGTDQRLEALAEGALMQPAMYRNFGDHEALVVSQTVNVGNNQAGIRWAEIRGLSSTPSIYQQGILSPDSDNRWLSSAGVDRFGDIGMVYNVSGISTYPSIRYTGHTASDPSGTMRDEQEMLTGTGSSNDGAARWGDYNSISVDPSDDCTFWITSMYIPRTSMDWHTRISWFRFPECGPQPAPSSSFVKLPLGDDYIVEVVAKPHRFTPNSGGRNDSTLISFALSGGGGPSSIAILKPNGGVLTVLGTFDPGIAGAGVTWNGSAHGKLQPPGTYTYRVRAEDPQGTVHTITGKVVLSR
jgi:hypothetical protein